MASADLTHELTCPICLELFTDPVSLECEHHFCRSCISRSWEEVPGDVSCPQCRRVFTQRNTSPARTLGNVVEQVRLLKVKAAEREEEFYCEEHGEKLKMFCEEGQEAICVDCWSSEHRTHRVIPVKEAAQIYKAKLEKSLGFLQQQTDLIFQWKVEGEIGILQIKAHVDALRTEINTEFGKMHKFLSEREELMKAELERKTDKILEEMGNYLTSTLDEMSSLEGVIRDLKARLEIQKAPEFLKDIQALLNRCEIEVHKPGAFSAELPVDIVGGPLKYVKVWKEMRAVISPVPTSLTLDPETANNQLVLSQDLTSVYLRKKKRELPDQLERFDSAWYVLSSMGFTSGRHYWEVGLGNKTHWVVGICSESVNRKGDIIPSPENGYWVIGLLPDYKSLKIPNATSHLEVKPRKLGVYLDYEGGQVLFYNADDMSHLYTFTDTFTEKIYPIFNPCTNKAGNNSEPLTLLTS
ncbi:zinc-binding protein A33-like [Heptranchias perlo]|uniref:zinc-binding protein A33-like n=1 Tax=Heptranchias perlo TaxID=212740 RepID=UPI00355A2B4F